MPGSRQPVPQQHGPRPEAVACDLDGTVLRTDGKVSERTRAALAAVEDSGALLVFVTGRPPRWIHPVADQTDHRGLAICANGALVYDLHTAEVVESTLIEPETLRAAIELLRARVPEIAFAVEYGGSFAHERTYPVQWEHVTDAVRQVEPGALADLPAAKLLLRHEIRASNELLAIAREVVAELVEVTHSTPFGPGLLEISAAGVSKATTLARLCARHGIGPDGVVAFGDMPNDLPMLAWAGRAYAMANAHPDVLAAVVRHTLSNDEDGVAVVIEELFG
jgi:Cof subfamily protein (haloacid dehalogenase superfamily)